MLSVNSLNKIVCKWFNIRVLFMVFTKLLFSPVSHKFQWTLLELHVGFILVARHLEEREICV